MDDNETFRDLSRFQAIPRHTALALSPDGGRLVAAVSRIDPDGTGFRTALWSIDPDGERAARQLTRSLTGEASPAFAPDGSLLFTSARPDPDAAKSASKDDDKVTALWRLPVTGEAELLIKRAGGISAFAVARDSGRLVLGTRVMPGALTAEDDENARKARKDAKVTAILHEEQLVRFWDHDLGTDRGHVMTADLGPEGVHGEPADLTPASRGRFATGVAISPDGALVAYEVESEAAALTGTLGVVVADATTGERRFVVQGKDHEFSEPVFTPDGRHLLCRRTFIGDRSVPDDTTLWIVELATRVGRDLTPDFEQWPGSPVPSPDGGAVFFTADEGGRAPVFRVDVADGTITRLTASGAYSAVCPSPDGDVLYALGGGIDGPPMPVRLDARAADQTPTRLDAPGDVGDLPGTLTEIHATAEDGTPLRSWLVLPAGASAADPAPLLLWVHGGPASSWNSWSWRWNPWLAAARGWAVLLPDPVLSTGYGQHHHERAVGDWSEVPYSDVIAVTDVACARPDIDADHTAMMGGSFGGYMANLIAGRTNRFKAIVTHASLWNIPAFLGATDFPAWWRRGYGDPLTDRDHLRKMSPHEQAANITTPVLVIHGDKDYRVPISEGLALWADLTRHEVPAKFLYFPDEGHWVLKPGNVKVWYETVFAFLDHHVHGLEWRRPELV